MSNTLKLIVDPNGVLQINAGVRGAPGPAGAAGSGFNFVQVAPATTWTINHLLGFKPSVGLFTSGGVAIFADSVTHIDVNQTVVTWAAAQSGFARLS